MMSEIADFFEKMCGHYYTSQTMSNMAKVLTGKTNVFKARVLNEKYVVIFMNATYTPLKRMKDTILQIYPKAKYQHCCVHVSRNIAHEVWVQDRKEICSDFKAVYQVDSAMKKYSK